MLWKATFMAITKQRISKGVLPRRSGLGQILEFVMPFQNTIPYTQVPQVEDQSQSQCKAQAAMQ